MADHYRRYNYSESFECDGVWWSVDGRIPESPGRLTYEPGDAARLKLQGTFSFSLSNNLDDLGIIYGKLTNGILVTLTEPLNIGETINFASGGISDLVFISNIAFAGDCHVTTDDVFQSAKIGLSSLASWIDRTAFSPTSPTRLSDGTLQTSIQHSCSIGDKYYVPEIQASISLDNGFNTSSDECSRSITNEESISIVPRKKQSASWYFQKVLSLNILICSLSATPGTVNYISLRRQKSRNKYSDVYDPFVTAFGSSATTNSSKIISRYNVLIPYSSVQNRTKSILQNWFQRSGTANTASTMLHSIRLRRPSLDIGLIIRIQAFEAWMQDNPSSSYIPKSAFRKIRKKMMAAVHSDLSDQDLLRESIINSLNFGNEKSLAEKLIWEAESIDKNVAKRLLLMESDEFCRLVASTRNHLTHRSNKTRKNLPKSGKPLYDLCDSLEWFMWYLIISDIGVPKSVLDKTVMNHNRTSPFSRGRDQASQV